MRTCLTHMSIRTQHTDVSQTPAECVTHVPIQRPPSRHGRRKPRRDPPSSRSLFEFTRGYTPGKQRVGRNSEGSEGGCGLSGSGLTPTPRAWDAPSLDSIC